MMSFCVCVYVFICVLNVKCSTLGSVSDNERMQMRRSGLGLKLKLVYWMLLEEEEDYRNALSYVSCLIVRKKSNERYVLPVV